MGPPIPGSRHTHNARVSGTPSGSKANAWQAMRAVFVVDELTWGYGSMARGLAEHLNGEHEIDILDHAAVTQGIDFSSYDCVIGLSSWWLWKALSAVPSNTRVLTYVSNEVHFREDFLRRCILRSECVLCSSQRIRERLSALYGDVGLRRLPNTIDSELFALQPFSRRAQITVGWAGSTLVHHGKGVELIEAAVDGTEDVIFRKQDRREEAVPHRKMPDFYRGIDVYVNMSDHEGGPLTILEALSCGRYVITTDVGVVRELEAQGAQLSIIPRTVEALRAEFRKVPVLNLAAIGRRNREIIRRYWDHRVGARWLRNALASRNRKVAILSGRSGIGGGQRRTRQFKNAFSALGHDNVDVLSDDDDGAFQRNSNPVSGRKVSLREYDVVIAVPGAGLKSLTEAKPGAMVIAVLATATEWTYNMLRGVDFAKVTCWLIVHDVLRQWLLNAGEPPNKIVPFPNLIDPVFRNPTDAERTQARKRLRLEPGRSTITYVGRLSGEKRIEDLVCLCSILAKRGDYELLVVSGVENQWNAVVDRAIGGLAQQLGLRDRVVRIGPFDSDVELRDVYWSTDCMVLASLFEGMPNVLVEAAACGVPFVAPPVGNIKRFAKETGAGICHPRAGATYTQAELERFADVVNSLVTTRPEIDVAKYRAFRLEELLDRLLETQR